MNWNKTEAIERMKKQIKRNSMRKNLVEYSNKLRKNFIS